MPKNVPQVGQSDVARQRSRLDLILATPAGRQALTEVLLSDATVERVARALMDTPPDMLTAEPYTVARALLAAAGRGDA